MIIEFTDTAHNKVVAPLESIIGIKIPSALGTEQPMIFMRFVTAIVSLEEAERVANILRKSHESY